MFITFSDFVDLMGQNNSDPSYIVEAWEAYASGNSDIDMEIEDNEE